MNNLKIKNIILISFVSVCVLSSILIYSFMYNYFSKIHIQRSKDYGRNSVELNAKIIEKWLDEKVVLLNNLSDKLIYFSIKNEDEIEKILKEYVNVASDYNDFYIGTEQNEFIDANGWDPSSDYNVSTRPWYRAVQKSKDKAVLTNYYDVCLHREVIGISVKSQLIDTKCVIGSNIEIEEIIKRVEDIEYFDTGFGFIVDDNNKLIAKPENISNQEKEMIEEIAMMWKCPTKNNELSLFNKEGYVIVSKCIEKYGWDVVLVAKVNEFNAYKQDLFKKVNIIFLCILSVVVLFSLYMSRRISQPIETLMSKVRNIATGKFYDSVLIDSKWELGELSIQLENMRMNILRILEKMELESELLTINHQQLEEYLNNTKKGTVTFISMLSHDIKTPITLIKGYATGLQQGIVSTKEKQERYLESIKFRADQIEKILTNNLDNVYEINNRLVLNQKKVELFDFINTVKSISKNYIEAGNRVFKADIKIEKENTYLNVDIVKMQRVIDNLLSNSIKFSEKASEIKLIVYDQEDKLYVGIQDKGVGISKDNMEKIFDMFYREDNSKKGYGLGLCVCKSIVSAHQGEMFVENKEVGCLIGFCLNTISNK